MSTRAERADAFLQSILISLAKLQKADTLDNHVDELGDVDDILADLVADTVVEAQS